MLQRHLPTFNDFIFIEFRFILDILDVLLEGLIVRGLKVTISEVIRAGDYLEMSCK